MKNPHGKGSLRVKRGKGYQRRGGSMRAAREKVNRNGLSVRCWKVKQPFCRGINMTTGNSRLLLLVGIVVVCALAYCNSFTGPFIFDDLGSIPGNSSLQSLWSSLTRIPGAQTVTGRPILNFSFAVNHVICGNSVWMYHVTNLVIHVLAGLTLFGIVRRTMSEKLALVIATVWLLHPLQTESVTYIVQRAESLAGLFYLLALYCFIRSIESSRAIVWQIACVVTCLLGVGTKEIVASAPIVILLYDRAFVAGSFAEAWRSRRWIYVALASTWIPLGVLMFGTHGRAGSAGFNAGIAWTDYAQTQCVAICRYLRLSFWPNPLVLDYGTPVVTDLSAVAPCAAVIALLLSGTVVALWRWPKVGFAGVAFFACLAPTSSVIPITTQTIAEHRMYLALAPEIALVVVGIAWLMRRAELVRAIATAAVALALAVTTFGRNRDYRISSTIWLDTLAKCPTNARAANAAATALFQERRPAEAFTCYDRAIQLEPDNPRWRSNRGNAHLALGQFELALADYNGAIRIDSTLGGAFVNRAVCEFQLKRYDEAMADVGRARSLHINPHPDFVRALEQAAHRDIAIVNTPLDRR